MAFAAYTEQNVHDNTVMTLLWARTHLQTLFRHFGKTSLQTVCRPYLRTVGKQSTSTVSRLHTPLNSQFKTSCRTVNVWLGFVLPVFFSHIRGADEEIVANGGLGTFSMKDRGMGKIV